MSRLDIGETASVGEKSLIQPCCGMALGRKVPAPGRAVNDGG